MATYGSTRDEKVAGDSKGYAPLESEKAGSASVLSSICKFCDVVFFGCFSWCKAPCFGSKYASRRLVLSIIVLILMVSYAGFVLVDIFSYDEGSPVISQPDHVEEASAPPLAPENIRVISVGYDHVELRWSPGRQGTSYDAQISSQVKSSSGKKSSQDTVGKNDTTLSTVASKTGNRNAETFTVWVSGPLPPSAANGKTPSSIVFARMLKGERRPGDGSDGGSIRVDGLEAGKGYCVQVRGDNQAGQGDTSAIACFATLDPRPPGSPGAPRAVGANSTALWLRWSPSESRGYALRGYELQCRPWRGSWAGSRFRTAAWPSTSHNEPGVLLSRCPTSPLTSGTWYEVRVRGLSAKGGPFGTWSPTSLLHTDRETVGSPLAPSKPPIVSKRGPSSASVAWDRPTDNGSEILMYHVGYRLSKTAQWAMKRCPAPPPRESPRTELTGLNPGSLYEVAVAAESASGGIGQYSRIATFRTMSAEVPSQVTDIKITSINGSATILEWPVPSAGGMDIISYQIETDDWFWERDTFAPRKVNVNLKMEEDSEQVKAQATLLDLLPSGEYKVRVRAQNMVGFGKWSDERSFESPEEGHCGTKRNMRIYSDVW
eukprot:CAMPEP_0167749732 /NCGR_PEP_ID=MMETSP0110_2-20121227/5586_1 /TAXON_ID=629695 /ORGANISM="Gymnochlora sp., Strain CCMP2014" /LENGTH=601 /DNA_ID=CAMNT_0007634949 /DNA_START=155 /DNA_END=1957 /DNA_ORIENTATION=+